MRVPVRSLPLQLFTVLALPLLILLMLVTFSSVSLHRAAMRDLATGHDVQAVRGVAASLSGRLEHQEQVLAGLAERALENPDKAAALRGWSDTLFDGGVAFYDERGDLLAATEQANDWQSSSPLRPDLSEALDNVRPDGEAIYVPLVDGGRNDTRIGIVLSLTSHDGSILRAIGVSSLDALDLPILMETLRTSEHAVITVASRQGRVLYASDPSLVGGYLPHKPYTQAALRGESGADYLADRQGRERIISFAPVPEPGWTLIQEELWTEMLSPIMRYSQAFPLVLIPGLGIAAIGAWFAINAIVRPLQVLETRAADLAAGNFDSIRDSVDGIEEIQRLQASLQLMAGQLEKAQELMRHYIAAITRAQEEERLRLAHELHDHMIQALIALDHREQVLRRYLNDDPTGAEVLVELREMTGQAIDDLRRIIRAMRPIYLEDLGLVPALEALARDTSAIGDADVHFEKTGTPRRLPPEQEITLYRVAQEALNNARQHSAATNIWLTVRFEDQQVALSVRDNGQGFRAPKRVTDLPRNGHFGLIGMYERAELAGATLAIQSAPGKGTTITIRAKDSGS